ncbi:MAG: exo-alpha-sialidase [Candidatus Hydrogenedentes bacterium]|nr:exo-alpha-sialidase [Candidatus Hydrogenedentota bacterium]
MAISMAPNFAADEIAVERAIGTEVPGEYKHPCTITELDNGDLYIAYYGGSGEYEDDSKVWGMRKAKGATSWSAPVCIADTPFLGEGNPVVWQAPNGIVWLFYVQRHGDTWSDSRIKAKISTDGATTWSDSFMITHEQGMMVQGLPTVLNDGTYLLPAYYETGHDQEKTDPDTASLFFRIDPRTKTWTETGKIMSDKGNLQPHAVQLTDDYLIAYCRRGGTFEPLPDGRIIRAESHDGGKTWSRGTPSQFKNPNAAIAFIRLRNGHLLLVYNDSIAERTPLTASVSTDNDKTWPFKRNLAESDETQTFAYPVAIQTRDGRIHVVCTHDSRKTILHFTFDEEAILSHKADQ